MQLYNRNIQQTQEAWDSLSIPEQVRIINSAVDNKITDLTEIKKQYNSFAEDGKLEEWKALNNIDFEIIPDTTFTRDKTGAGSIEYFNSKYPEGVTYPNGYHKPHPMPNKDVILYNPNENDMQDVRLDALHIMPKDATYDALNSLYRDAAINSDVTFNAKNRYNEDLKKYGKENIDSYQDYFNNEADGLLRNMFIEGTPEYIKSRRYYPNKAQLKEWNSNLMPYINNIRSYLETGIRPSNILPEVIITPNKKALGGPTDEKTKNSKLPSRRPMPRHPKNREKDPAAYDDYIRWKEEMTIRKQHFEKQQQINKTDNNKGLDRINSLVGTLNESTNTPIFNGEEIKEAAEKQREEKLKKWENYKLGLEATASAAELLSAGYGIIRGLTYLGKKGAQYALFSKNPLFNTTPANYRKWKNIAETWDKPQTFMNTLGGLADGYQWITADNSYDAWENGIETGGNVAGVIGGTNWFRNQPFFGRYGDRIDTTLDIMGYGSAAWDVAKNLPPLSTAINKAKSKETTDENFSHKKVLGGPLVKAANMYDGFNEESNQMVHPTDATYVSKPVIYKTTKVLSPEEKAINRAYKVFSNYHEAKDNPLSIPNMLFRNALRWGKDNIDEDIRSGVSNCTLTATQWVDPDNPIKNASSILADPQKYNYIPIDSTELKRGNVVITKNPNNNSHHTMLISDFAGQDSIVNFDGKPYKVKKGEPLLTYSRGGHDESFLRKNIPFSAYTPNSDGKTKNFFFKYNYSK